MIITCPKCNTTAEEQKGFSYLKAGCNGIEEGSKDDIAKLECGNCKHVLTPPNPDDFMYRVLDCQYSDEEPIAYTHFDQWPDPKFGKALDKKNVKFARELATEWAREFNIPKLNWLADKYLELGQVEFFRIAAEIWAEAGYPVYDGEEFFEVYKEPEDAGVGCAGCGKSTMPNVEMFRLQRIKILFNGELEYLDLDDTYFCKDCGERILS